MPAAKRRRVVQQGAAALGKLILTVPRAVVVPTVLQLPFFICVLALVGVAHAVPNELEAAQSYIQDAVRDADGWAGALVTWAAAQDAIGVPPQPASVAPAGAPSAAAVAAEAEGHGEGQGEAAPAAAASSAATWSERVAAFLPTLTPESPASTTTISLRFRGSALREGQHRFKKPEVLAFVGNGVGQRLGKGAVVNLTQYDLEVVALIHEKVSACVDRVGVEARSKASWVIDHLPDRRPSYSHNFHTRPNSICTSA